jgi:hypothetical protein
VTGHECSHSPVSTVSRTTEEKVAVLRANCCSHKWISQSSIFAAVTGTQALQLLQQQQAPSDMACRSRTMQWQCMRSIVNDSTGMHEQPHLSHPWCRTAERALRGKNCHNIGPQRDPPLQRSESCNLPDVAVSVSARAHKCMPAMLRPLCTCRLSTPGFAKAYAFKVCFLQSPVGRCATHCLGIPAAYLQRAQLRQTIDSLHCQTPGIEYLELAQVPKLCKGVHVTIT